MGYSRWVRRLQISPKELKVHDVYFVNLYVSPRTESGLVTQSLPKPVSDSDTEWKGAMGKVSSFS